jgi:hypothetical protein
MKLSHSAELNKLWDAFSSTSVKKNIFTKKMHNKTNPTVNLKFKMLNNKKAITELPNE